ncbi:MAG: hypothetical protein U5L72_03880 [Bacteroidales bacterium]|nr:hypothetical protein [Bacteroidales bacterium]
MKKLLITCLLVPYSLLVLSQPLSTKEIDRLAEDAMTAFNVPGVQWPWSGMTGLCI